MPHWWLMMIVAARRLIQRGTRRTASNHSGRSSGRDVPTYPAADRMAIWPLKATVKAISQAASA